MNSLNQHTYPKITVITPSYNQGKYLEQTILSVINQNYPNLEYILIDGGSKDNSVEIIKKYAHKITFWVSEPDKGQSEAINKGLSRATGEIINWLNSDDYYEPGALFKVAEAFRTPDIKVVAGRSHLFKGKNEFIQDSKGTDVYPNNLAKTIGWARIDQPETFFRKEAIDIMGPLDTRLHYLMDRDWWIKYLMHFGLTSIKRIPDFLVNFRLHEDSKTVSQFKKFQIEHDTYFFALAKKYDVMPVANLIEEFAPINNKFELKYNFPDNKKLIIQILNYYLLLRANEFYTLYEKKKTRKILKSINTNLLLPEDKALWYKLNFRNKLPISLIKLFRK